MEVTINYNGQAVAVEVTLEVYEFLDRADHKAENLSHEQRRHWDGREFDEYIVATEGVGIYGETPEEYLCRMETLGELMAVLDTCTEAQRRRFLLYALDGLTLAEIGAVCGCSKVPCMRALKRSEKIFKFFENTLTNDPFSGYQVKGIVSLIPAGGGQRTSCPPLPFSGGKPMKTINLRWIYPHYRHDEFVEVSDEVWEVMRQAQREMNNYERRKVYHRAYYSLDAYSWTENYALEHGRSPEEILLEREERAAHLRLLAALPEALAHATPTQARRVRAYYIAGISQPEISRREGVDSSKVSVAIRRGLRNMRRCYDCLFPAE